jgi:hypothetical protein
MLALFIIGAGAGVLLGLWCLIRPSRALTIAATVAAVLWLLAYGLVTVLNIANPIGEVVSVLWIAVLGVLGGTWAYRARALST